MTKRITFVLPGSSGAPAGGPRIVYEYANRLASKGHRVTVIHSPVTRIDPDWRMLAKAAIRYPQRVLDKSFRPDAWMTVHPLVSVRWLPTLHGRFVPNADIVIATAWMTAEWVAKYGENKGKKFYFIQHYEDWDGPASRVEATWKLPLKKIVIAQWLWKIAERLGQTASIVPNAIDTGKFYCIADPKVRNPSHIAMLYHKHEWKGCQDGLAALRSVKEAVPELTAELFGVPNRPNELPGWIAYHQNPPQEELRAIYNRAAIYLAPSWAEGFALPPMEAAACGAALVATDIGGFKEFAEHEFNALLAPVKSPEKLAENLLELIKNKDRRVNLACNGKDRALQFNWDESVARFESVLLNQLQEFTTN